MVKPPFLPFVRIGTASELQPWIASLAVTESVFVEVDGWIFPEGYSTVEDAMDDLERVVFSPMFSGTINKFINAHVQLGNLENALTLVEMRGRAQGRNEARTEFIKALEVSSVHSVA